MSIKLSIILLLCLASPEISRGQWTPAFDSNCYFPVIGQAGTMDTLYGSQNEQNMGRIFVNLGESPVGTPDRILISGLPKNIPFVSSVDVSDGLNLKKMKIGSKCQLPLGRYRTGNFRSPRVKDLLYGEYPGGWRIYWADDNGDFDTSRYTVLLSNVYRLFGKGQGNNFHIPYIARVSSDTVDDIVWEADTQYGIPGNDTSYLVWWKGGATLAAKGKEAAQDSLLFWSRVIEDTLGSVTGYRRLWQGDFRGTGRQDVVAVDGHMNFFFFRNDPPFSLAKFAHSLEFDTLIADWQNSKRAPLESNTSWTQEPFVIKALPKQPEDSSADLFIPMMVNDDKFESHHIFRGGSSFGSHRLTYDSAEVVLRHPAEYEFSRFRNIGHWGDSFEDCGDMSGSGDPVIHTTAYLQGTSFHFFYVLGKAIDDKIDAYTIGGYFGDGPAIRVNANKDKYDDALIAARMLTVEEDYLKDKKFVGSLQLLYGTDQIPHQPKLQYLSVKDRAKRNPVTVGIAQRSLSISGLPDGSSRLRVLNVLGAVVLDREMIPQDGHYSVADQPLVAGVYFLEVESVNGLQTQKFIILD